MTTFQMTTFQRVKVWNVWSLVSTLRLRETKKCRCGLQRFHASGSPDFRLRCGHHSLFLPAAQLQSWTFLNDLSWPTLNYVPAMCSGRLLSAHERRPTARKCSWASSYPVNAGASICNRCSLESWMCHLGMGHCLECVERRTNVCYTYTWSTFGHEATVITVRTQSSAICILCVGIMWLLTWPVVTTDLQPLSSQVAAQESTLM